MKHFLEISALTRVEIENLILKGLAFKQNKKFPAYPHLHVAQLFYENSTRTRVSFELAAKNLFLNVVNLDLSTSSENKGETVADTVQTLAAMDIPYFVIRHQSNTLHLELSNRWTNGVQIINAGAGTYAHPSQALLDALTIFEHKKQFADLKIAILGDLRHSRVASSFQCLCRILGVKELALIAPLVWQPEVVHYGYVTNNIKEGLAHADIIMCLRVQKERLLPEENLDIDTYRKEFALTEAHLQYAKPEVMVMHPGPINRGVEIDSEVADGKNSLILQQVKNGIYARMAIFDTLITSSRG